MTAGTFADVRRVWLDDGGAEATSRRTTCARAPRTRSPTVCGRTLLPMCRSACFCRAGSIRARSCHWRAEFNRICIRTRCRSTTARLTRRPLAARVAEHFGTTHHALAVESRTIVREWPSILAHLDQPTADAINSYCVSRVVRESGVKCVLVRRWRRRGVWRVSVVSPHSARARAGAAAAPRHGNDGGGSGAG